LHQEEEKENTPTSKKQEPAEVQAAAELASSSGLFEKGANAEECAAEKEKNSEENQNPAEESENNDDATTEPIEEEEVQAEPVVEKSPPSAWDLWDTRHLRLPCSSHCRNKWETISTSMLKPIPDLETLLDLIVTVASTQTSRKNLAGLAQTVGSFSAEEKHKFFSEVLPVMARAVLALPERLQEHGKPIPLLLAGSSDVVRLPRVLVFSLLAAGFFCMLPQQGHRDARLATCNFRGLFGPDYDRGSFQTGDSRSAKLRCFLHYFERGAEPPQGEMAVRRSVLDTSDMDWEECCTPLTVVEFKHEESIEECGGTVQVDFANRVLGGGVLGRGAVQEEIRFSICPELLISRLLCSAMQRHEAVVIYGTEQFASYEGYASSFCFAGPHHDSSSRAEDGSVRSAVLAIDATNFHSNPGEQYREESLERELNKAFCGFDASSSVPASPAPPGEEAHLGLLEMPGCRARICTGNWGCGVFGGEVEAKFVMQLLAASRALRPVIYVAYRDKVLAARLSRLNAALRQHATTVGELYALAVRYCGSRYSSLDFDDMLEFVEAGGDPEKKAKAHCSETEQDEGEEKEEDEEDTDVDGPSVALSCEASDAEEEEEETEGERRPEEAAAPAEQPATEAGEAPAAAVGGGGGGVSAAGPDRYGRVHQLQLPADLATKFVEPTQGMTQLLMHGLTPSNAWLIAEGELGVWASAVPPPLMCSNQPIAAFDFDHTLASCDNMKGGPGDWTFLQKNGHDLGVKRALTWLHEAGYLIVIISNNSVGGKVNFAPIKTYVERKFGRIENLVAQLDGIPVVAMVPLVNAKSTNRPSGVAFHKPSRAAWDWLVQTCEASGQVRICRERSFYVGDAAGRMGDHSAADQELAAAAGLPFFNESEFFHERRPPLLPGGGKELHLFD